MESDPNQMSQSASLCRSGCGFYGNPSNDGLCSKCYKDALKRKQAAPTTASSSSNASSSINVDNATNIKTLIASSTNTSPLVSNTSVSSVSSAISAQDSSQLANVEANLKKDCTTTPEKPINSSEINTSATTTEEETPTKTQKKKKMRCPICRANLGIIQFECRCGGLFCATHRYANEHNCSFDYKEHGAEEIRKNNPQIIGEKVQKI